MPDSAVLAAVREARLASLKAQADLDAAAAAQAAAVEAAANPPAEPVVTEPAAEPVASAAEPAPSAEPPAEAKAAPVATFKAAYVSDDGVIYGIGAYAESFDRDDDNLRTKALVKMAYDFCAASTRTFKACHKEELGADLVASMPGAPILKSGRVLKAGEEIPSNDPVTGIDLKAEPIAWFVGVRPRDPDVSEMARKGEIVGFSWGAYVDRELVKE